eukprot:1159599-Pelagomonas_calceolata.AAC.2
MGKAVAVCGLLERTRAGQGMFFTKKDMERYQRAGLLLAILAAILATPWRQTHPTELQNASVATKIGHIAQRPGFKSKVVREVMRDTQSVCERERRETREGEREEEKGSVCAPVRVCIAQESTIAPQHHLHVRITCSGVVMRSLNQRGPMSLVDV